MHEDWHLVWKNVNNELKTLEKILIVISREGEKKFDVKGKLHGSEKKNLGVK